MPKRKQQSRPKSSLKPKAKYSKKTGEATVDWDDEDACEQPKSLWYPDLCLTLLPVHDARDRILLEEEEQQVSEDELDNEVFALPDVPDSEQGSVNEVDEGSIEETPVPVLPPNSRSKEKVPKKTAPAETAGNVSGDDRESEHEESWGQKKSVYYSTNAAQIDSDDEEAWKLEEAEVLRLQAQARDALDEADFGLFDAPSLSKDALEESVIRPMPYWI